MKNLEVMVILFIIVILGYVACKLGYMGDKFDKKLSSMVVDITCPLLVLSSVMGDELPDRTLILPLLGVGFEPDPSGQTEGIQFWGSSFVAGPQGELYYRASDQEEESLVVDIDLKHSENVRRWWPFLRDRRIENYGDITRRFID